MRRSTIFLLFILFSFSKQLYAQDLRIDSSGKVISSSKLKTISDTAAKKYRPGVAIRRSAILPGWGQYTNKKYWKIPIVYAALGTTGYLFFRNFHQYKESKEAYELASDNDPSNDYLIKEPYYSLRAQPGRIKSFRNSVRQNVDYCVLFFIVFWGLNVADAAVDANLKTFDVTDDLSLHIKAGYSPMANTNGVSLVMQIGKRK